MRPDRKRPGVVPARPGSAGSGHQRADPEAQLPDSGADHAVRRSPRYAQLKLQLQARLTSLQELATQITVQRTVCKPAGPQTAVLDRAISAARVHGRRFDNALLGGILGLVARHRPRRRAGEAAAEPRGRVGGLPGHRHAAARGDEHATRQLDHGRIAGRRVLRRTRRRIQQRAGGEIRRPGAGHGRTRARVRMLEGPLHRLRFSESRSMKPAGGTLQPRWRCRVMHRPPPRTCCQPERRKDSPRTGLVVAVPRVVKAADVDALTNFIWISGWTLLGVIIYSPPRKAIRTAYDARWPGRLGPRKFGHSARGGRRMVTDLGAASGERIPFARIDDMRGSSGRCHQGPDLRLANHGPAGCRVRGGVFPLGRGRARSRRGVVHRGAGTVPQISSPPPRRAGARADDHLLRCDERDPARRPEAGTRGRAIPTR